MLSALAAARAALARLAAAMRFAAGWTFVACALFVTFDVLARKLAGFSSRATVELTGYMLAFGISWSLADALTRRAHIRIDVLIAVAPLRIRQFLHAAAVLALLVFAFFLAWQAVELVRESILFGATDNSALSVPLVIPQGLWAFGLVVFFLAVALLALETLLRVANGDAEGVERLLGPRTFRDETAEVLEALAEAKAAKR